MIDPVRALWVVGTLLVMVILVLWPGWGIRDRWARARRNAHRVLMEDALKHLYDCEYRQILSTRQSIAGAIGLGDDDASRLLSRLTSLGLVSSHGDGFVLTDDGRSYALRIIRVHRLWER